MDETCGAPVVLPTTDLPPLYLLPHRSLGDVVPGLPRVRGYTSVPLPFQRQATRHARRTEVMCVGKPCHCSTSDTHKLFGTRTTNLMSPSAEVEPRPLDLYRGRPTTIADELDEDPTGRGASGVTGDVPVGPDPLGGPRPRRRRESDRHQSIHTDPES